jgi:ankyrin repeat protein
MTTVRVLNPLRDFSSQFSRRGAMAHSLVRKYRAGITSDFVNAARTSLIARFILALVMVLALFRGLGISGISDARESQLIQAASSGDLVRVKMLLERGTEVDARDEHGSTPLMWAARGGHVQVVRVLLRRGADINARDGCNDATPLIWAACAGRTDVVKLLLDSNSAYAGPFKSVRRLLSRSADVNAQDRHGITALIIASDRGHLDIVHLLLDKGADVHARSEDVDNDGLTALVCAAYGGTLLQRWLAGRVIPCMHLPCSAQGEISSRRSTWSDYCAIVKLLLDRGAAINTQSWNCTALGGAANRGDLELAKLLLAKGARVNGGGPYGSPLSEAAGGGHLEIAKLLLGDGANARGDDLSNMWAAPLNAAAANGHLEVVRLLLEKGADVNSGSPLAAAARSGHMDVVKLLIDRGANVAGKDENGRSRIGNAPLSAAAEGGNLTISKLLLDQGADVNAKSSSGSTALMYAARQGSLEIVRLLLDRGATVNAKTCTGRTALMGAATNGNLALVKLLVQKGTDVNAHVDAQFKCRTALNFAQEKSLTDVVQYLEACGARATPKGNDRKDVGFLRK